MVDRMERLMVERADRECRASARQLTELVFELVVTAALLEEEEERVKAEELAKVKAEKEAEERVRAEAEAVMREEEEREEREACRRLVDNAILAVLMAEQ
eukprot:218620-Prorocentrum_minimum.AAC.1